MEKVNSNVASTSFDPQVSDQYNLASLTMRDFSYIRIGDYLQVMGSFSFVATNDQQDCGFRMKPPFPHVFVDGDLFAQLVGGYTLFPENGQDYIHIDYLSGGFPYPAGIMPVLYWIRVQ